MKTVALLLLAACLALRAPVALAAEEVARLPYDKLCEAYHGAVASAKVTTAFVVITSHLEGVAPKDIKLWLQQGDTRTELVLDGDGFLTFRPAAAIEGTGAVIVTNQPRGSLDLQVMVAPESKEVVSPYKLDGKHYREAFAGWQGADGGAAATFPSHQRAGRFLQLDQPQEYLLLVAADGTALRLPRTQSGVMLPLEQGLWTADPVIAVVRQDALYAYVCSGVVGERTITAYVVVGADGQVRQAYGAQGALPTPGKDVVTVVGPLARAAGADGVLKGAAFVATRGGATMTPTPDRPVTFVFRTTGTQWQAPHQVATFFEQKDGLLCGFFPLAKLPPLPTKDDLQREPVKTLTAIYADFAVRPAAAAPAR